ncbi:hypothetical protein BG52_09575 [Paenibacillus darwinianus]|nr:hypothetical protein CH50_10620 [Paenibacillus darwinianus]EXX84941.1 hypothetical protein BG52_09575 [Paenibacillus darwinianus]
MAVKDGKEYVSFMTKRFVAYMETPTEERRRIRTEAKSRREPWLARWFGWAPYGVIMWWQARQLRKERARAAAVSKESDIRQS